MIAIMSQGTNGNIRLSALRIASSSGLFAMCYSFSSDSLTGIVIFASDLSAASVSPGCSVVPSGLSSASSSRFSVASSGLSSTCSSPFVFYVIKSYNS
jgi:hypothetical protein